MDSLSELDEAFEPLTRARSNTWPLPRPEYELDSTNSPTGCCHGSDTGNGHAPIVPTGLASKDNLHHFDSLGPLQVKKNSSRRNAWGNMSYADLITQAIQSSPENRLTLSQIYDWMVQNVPYFKDKGDSNSSAGWKNSIRHNLSLHNRFMRVQNEGAGKSSWWMINPDARPGKAARRRAASMETQKYEKKRGRIKRKVEQMRAAAAVSNCFEAPHEESSIEQTTPTRGSSEGLDIFPESPPMLSGFQLSPDFRPRTSSNASSCSRLSPIGCEPSLLDSPMSPLNNWNSNYNSMYSTPGGASNNDVMESLKLCDTMTETMSLNDVGVVPTVDAPINNSSFNSFASSYSDQVGPIAPCNVIRVIKTEQPPPPYRSPDRTPTHIPNNVVIKQDVSLGNSLLATANHIHTLNQTSTLNDVADVLANQGSLSDQRGNAIKSTGPMLPSGDDINLDQLQETIQGGLECDVDQVIFHELNMGGSLDFAFDSTASGNDMLPTMMPSSVKTELMTSEDGAPMQQQQHQQRDDSSASSVQYTAAARPPWVR